MRLYKNLETKTPKELRIMLDTVKTSTVLTKEEQDANINLINSILNPMKTNDKVLKDIESGMADLDDLN